MAFSPDDGRRLVTAGAGGNDLPGAQLLIWTRPPARSWSPGGRCGASAQWRIRRTGRSSPPATGAARSSCAISSPARLAGNIDRPRDRRQRPGVFGRRVLLASSAPGLDQTVKVWDVQARRERQELRGHEGMVFGVAFFHHGRALVEQRAGIERFASGTSTPARNGWCCAATPTGSRRWPCRPTTRWWRVGSWDQTIKFWGCATGQPTGTLRQNGSNVLAYFSPDGALRQVAGLDGTIHLWDAASREHLHRARLHQGITLGRGVFARRETAGERRPGQDRPAVGRGGRPARGEAVGRQRRGFPGTSPRRFCAAGRIEGWLAAAVMLGLLLTLVLASCWIYLRQRRRDGQKAPEGDAGGLAHAVREGKTARLSPDEEPIAVACSGCGKSLKARVELAGKRIRCPQCNCAVVVPTDRD